MIETKKKNFLDAITTETLFIPEQFMEVKRKHPLIEQWPVENGEPVVSVGIMECEEVKVSFEGAYHLLERNERVDNQMITFSIKDLVPNKANSNNPELNIISLSPNGIFAIDDVTIGIGFHWQRQERQAFRGSLRLLLHDGKIVVINRIKVEDYLESVISSEMSANAGLELLKAHAIMSRSWLLRVNDYRKTIDACYNNEDEVLRWYERDAHELFDVCADDHCQRYQGVLRVVNENAAKAVEETRGMVLTYNSEICDARFSKCCGGSTERFSSAWDDRDYDYLQPVDCEFCNTKDKQVLSQVLNDYDLETVDFHDWEVRYSVEELSELVCRKSGIDFGMITALEPLERGESGRITKLRIVGTKHTVIVGKELEIRKWLSETHLYSSNFEVEFPAVLSPQTSVLLKGKGWGHGVGLCQIGAAVMASKGYTYPDILSYYFSGSKIEKLY